MHTLKSFEFSNSLALAVVKILNFPLTNDNFRSIILSGEASSSRVWKFLKRCLVHEQNEETNLSAWLATTAKMNFGTEAHDRVMQSSKGLAKVYLRFSSGVWLKS